MKIKPVGASGGEVTGSVYLVRTNRATILVDAGMFQGELLNWFSTLAPGKPKVFLTHGEDRGRGTLAKLIQQRFKLSAGLPRQGEVIEI